MRERNLTANQLGALLNVSRMTISRYRHGSGMNDLHVIKCAEMIGVSVPYAIASANAERVSDHESEKLKSAYTSLAEISNPAYKPPPKKRGPRKGTVYKSKPGPKPGSKRKKQVS